MTKNIDNNDISNFSCVFPFIIIKQCSATCKDFFFQKAKTYDKTGFQTCHTFSSHLSVKYTLRKKYPYSELFGSAFSRIRTEYGEILRVSPYSVRMLRTRITPNTDTFHAVIVCTKCFKNQPSAKLNPLKKQKYDAQKIKSAQKLIYFTGLKSRYHAVINEERCSEKQNVITNYFEITGKKLGFP